MSEKKPKVVLIVDDEPVTQLMVTVILQRKNFVVITANDGQDALDKLINADIDLVLADVNMPKMGGLKLLQQMRSDGRFQNLPVIMFTAQGQRQIQSDAITQGATDFLTKPFSSSKLADMVHHHLVPTAI
ncbi:MAG: response regulator [Ardenticatenaceae bacterium]|nr:response regulator [Ardenticatenaceae bacterium]